MHGTEGDMELKASPGRRLEKIRYKIFGKLLMLLPSLQRKAHSYSCFVLMANYKQSMRNGKSGKSPLGASSQGYV
jgi:hypothetical protein